MLVYQRVPQFGLLILDPIMSLLNARPRKRGGFGCCWIHSSSGNEAPEGCGPFLFGIPSGKRLQKTMERSITLLMGKSTIKWPCSIAMAMFTRGYQDLSCNPSGRRYAASWLYQRSSLFSRWVKVGSSNMAFVFLLSRMQTIANRVAWAKTSVDIIDLAGGYYFIL